MCLPHLSFVFLFLGPFPAGYLVWKVGRKWTLLGSTLPMLAGLILIAAAVDIWMIYIGRLLTGFSLSIMLTVTPMYCAEIATVRNKPLWNP